MSEGLNDTLWCQSVPDGTTAELGMSVLNPFTAEYLDTNGDSGL